MPFQCSNCGSVNADDATFCVNCGTSISAMVKPSGVQIQQKICANCHKPINVTFSTCPFCGAVQPSGYTETIGVPIQSGSHNKTTAGLLAILLGSFGVHKFYLGQGGQGFIYLIFCWTGIPGLAGIVEGIVYLTMNDMEFLQKYH